MCPRWVSNPHWDPFKGPASAGWATGAPGQLTGEEAVPCVRTISTVRDVRAAPREDAARALAALTADGASISTAVRTALIEIARARVEKSLRAESESLAANEDDRAEAAQVLRDMEALRVW